MNEVLQQSVIDGAAAYEALFVPSLTGCWAQVVLDAAGVGPGDRVLDVACGTGILARTAVARVGPGGYVAGVDPSPGMLHVARQRAPGVEWREGAAESLPYADSSFDVVASQFGFMFFEDREKAAREMLRVLRPKGRIAAAVWDRIENNAAFHLEAELLGRTLGPAAAEAVRMPYALGDARALAALFADAGVQGVEVLSRTATAEFPSIRAMVEADLRGWLPLVGVEVAEDRIGGVLAEAENVLAGYATGRGTVAFTTSALIVSGWR